MIELLTGGGLLTKVVAGAGALLVAFLALLGYGKKREVEGRKKEQAKQVEKINEKVEKADEVRRAVRVDPAKRDGVRKFDRG